MSNSVPIRRNVRLNICQGLHLRVCSNVVAIVNGFPGSVKIVYGDKSADASSIFDLLLLAALPNSELIVEAQGEGAVGIIQQIEKLFSEEIDPIQ